jgi:putative PIN family toxin of toxin-antitoxin system
MIVVVDTNIVFAALLSKGNKYARHLFETKNNWITPGYLFYEVFNHKERIVNKSKLSNDEFQEHFLLLFSHIDIINVQKVSTRSFFLANTFLKEKDPFDIPFLALAIELKAKIWTMDNDFRQGIIDSKLSGLYEPDLD